MLRKAEQGDAVAQFILGMFYDLGLGVAQDYGQAVQWFRKAAEQGHAQAQFNLGVRYAQGKGVAQDDEQAVQWYRKAAEQGIAAAQFILGVCYDQGQGVAQDDEQAVDWYRKAAGQGLAAAQIKLGERYPEEAQPAKPYVFISYSHDDRTYVDGLKLHLKPLTCGMIAAFARVKDGMRKPKRLWSRQR